VDWEVRHISDEKGLGLVALRSLQEGSRIMVEHELRDPWEHPRIVDLYPVGESIARKVALNGFSARDTFAGKPETVVCLRMSRANHACDPNAQECHVEGVMLLFALRTIAAGEEIEIDYTTREQLALFLTPEWSRDRLTHYGIKCPEGCICFDQDRAAKVSLARLLFWVLFSFVPKNEKGIRGDAIMALRVADRLLSLLDDLHAPPAAKRDVNYQAFQVSITSINTVKRYKDYIGAAHAHAVTTGRPDSLKALGYKEYCGRGVEEHPCWSYALSEIQEMALAGKIQTLQDMPTLMGIKVDPEQIAEISKTLKRQIQNGSTGGVDA